MRSLEGCPEKGEGKETEAQKKEKPIGRSGNKTLTRGEAVGGRCHSKSGQLDTNA